MHKYMLEIKKPGTRTLARSKHQNQNIKVNFKHETVYKSMWLKYDFSSHSLENLFHENKGPPGTCL